MHITDGNCNVIYSLIRISQLIDCFIGYYCYSSTRTNTSLTTLPQDCELSWRGEHSEDVHYIMWSKKSILWPAGHTNNTYFPKYKDLKKQILMIVVLSREWIREVLGIVKSRDFLFILYTLPRYCLNFHNEHLFYDFKK